MKVFDEAGNEIDIPGNVPVNDLTRAPKYMDTMPAGTVFIPVVIPAADKVTPRLALVNPTLIATTDEVLQKINEARKELVDSLVAEGVDRDAAQQIMIDELARQNTELGEQNLKLGEHDEKLDGQYEMLVLIDEQLTAAVTALQQRPSLVKLGDVNITYSATLALGAGSRPITVPLAGALATDRLLLYPKAAIPLGYSLSAGVKANAGSVTVSVVHPALALGANFSIPAEIWALR